MEDEQTAASPDVPGANTGEPNPELRFTQDDVNALVGKTRKEARAAAHAELAKLAGVQPDELAALLKTSAERREAEKTELEWARETLAEQSSQVERMTAELAERDRFDQWSDQWLKAGHRPDRTKASYTQAKAEGLLAEDADFSKSVASFIKRFPEWSSQPTAPTTGANAGKQTNNGTVGVSDEERRRVEAMLGVGSRGRH
jgi:hypothetical protein